VTDTTEPPRHDLQPWNLRDIIRALTTKAPAIEAVFLFGSRAYGTGSFRSDIDLLAITRTPLAASVLTSWLHQEFPPVDLFESNDRRIARSLINGSGLLARSDTDLIKQLDAQLLWSVSEGFSSSFAKWDQFTVIGANFMMTTFPLAANVVDLAANFTRRLEDAGYLAVFLGSNWDWIGQSLSRVVETALDTPRRFAVQAKYVSGKTIVLASEYDFQNLVHLVLRPWLPTIEKENVTIRYDDQDKVGDFGLAQNTVVIEAKHIKDADDKRAVLKDLAGLTGFYIRNPNVRLLLFWILVDQGVDINMPLIEGDFSDVSHEPVVIVKCFRNTLSP
jgi:hypothetical protein